MTRIEHANWQQSAAIVKDIRNSVFVCEWRIPRAVEFDMSDQTAEHVIVYEKDKPIATGRLCSDGYLSRVAVLPSKRETDAATKVFQALTGIAKQKNINYLTIAADLRYVELCTRGGFTCYGKVYMEAGVARQKLSCPTSRFSTIQWDWIH
ncbi:GNAT family N-acetyltransferase [Algibacillus agarilyticus]|uniref:GNAT family N-acetyltransferase n=1 Tax=Algibacillus agarilyticus TaxID=2234133 RepID=UPI000DCFCEBD|nr:GNAT family N-acetyltransferase [Algibacillus agarilyticus]